MVRNGTLPLSISVWRGVEEPRVISVKVRHTNWSLQTTTTTHTHKADCALTHDVTHSTFYHTNTHSWPATVWKQLLRLHNLASGPHTHTHAHTTDIKILTSNRPMEVSLHWCGSIHTETPQKISSSSFFRYQLVNLLITATFWSAVWNKTSHFRSWNQFGISLPNKWLKTINCLSELFLTNSIKWTNCLSSRFL